MKRTVAVGYGSHITLPPRNVAQSDRRPSSPSENVHNALNVAGPATVTLLPECTDARPANSKLRGSRVRSEASNEQVGFSAPSSQNANAERGREARRRRWQWEREQEKERNRRRPQRPKAGKSVPKSGSSSGQENSLQKSLSSVTLKLEGVVVTGSRSSPNSQAGSETEREKEKEKAAATKRQQALERQWGAPVPKSARSTTSGWSAPVVRALAELSKASASHSRRSSRRAAAGTDARIFREARARRRRERVVRVEEHFVEDQRTTFAAMYGPSKVRVDELVGKQEATEKKCDRERTADVVGLEREKLIEGGLGAAEAGEQEGEGRGGKGALQVDALEEGRPQEDVALDGKEPGVAADKDEDENDNAENDDGTAKVLHSDEVPSGLLPSATSPTKYSCKILMKSPSIAAGEPACADAVFSLAPDYLLSLMDRGFENEPGSPIGPWRSRRRSRSRQDSLGEYNSRAGCSSKSVLQTAAETTLTSKKKKRSGKSARGKKKGKKKAAAMNPPGPTELLLRVSAAGSPRAAPAAAAGTATIMARPRSAVAPRIPFPAAWRSATRAGSQSSLSRPKSAKR